jgi:pilus assembly protein CpaB
VLSYGQQDIAPVATMPPPAARPTPATIPRAADITGNGSSHGSNEATQPARSAVLAVPVADANRLLLGAQQGKLFLALRNPADTGLPDLALFPQARGVIDPLRGLDAEQQLALQRPENHAFAGIDGDALAGRGNAPPAATRMPPRAAGAAQRARRASRSSVATAPPPWFPLTCIERIHDRTSPPSTPFSPPALAGPAAGAAGTGNERGRRRPGAAGA